MSQIIGNSIPCKVGRKVYLMGYVSMGEYQVFRELFKKDEIEAVMMLVCYSLIRGGSVTGNVRRKLNRIIKKRPAILVTLVDIICKLSLPIVKIKDGDDGGDDESNIKTVYRLLAKHFTWTPPEISVMSPAQIFISLTGGPDGTGKMKMTDAQFASFQANRGIT